MKNQIPLGRGIVIFSFLFCLFFINFSKMYSQIDNVECFVFDVNNPDTNTVHSYLTDLDDLNTCEPLVLNVKFWKVNDPIGDFYADFSEDNLLAGIALLNITYNKFNIYFKYRGWEEFDSPSNVVDSRWECVPPNDPNCDYICVTYPNPDPSGFTILNRCQFYAFFTYISQNSYRDSSAINIYVTSWNTGFGNAAYTVGHNQMVLRNSSLNSSGMTHEMGHCLGLYHTRSDDNNPSDLEHTTREEFLPGGGDNPEFNAKGADDQVEDTAAIHNIGMVVPIPL
jgi:hypothetical protein